MLCCNYISSLEMILCPVRLQDHPARVGPNQVEHLTHWMYVSTTLTAFKTWEKISCMWFKVPWSQLWIDVLNCRILSMGELSLVAAGFVCTAVTGLDFPSKHTHCICAWDHFVSCNCSASSKTWKAAFWPGLHVFSPIPLSDSYRTLYLPSFYPSVLLVHQTLC